MKLKPCHFCGSERIEICHVRGDEVRYGCQDCHSQGPWGKWSGKPGDQNAYLAVEKWNTRHESSNEALLSKAVELIRVYKDHLEYLHDYYPDVYQDPSISAHEDIAEILSRLDSQEDGGECEYFCCNCKDYDGEECRGNSDWEGSPRNDDDPACEFIRLKE